MLMSPQVSVNSTQATGGRKKRRKVCFCINDHSDLLVEILKRLDPRSLGVAACVCRLWCSIAGKDVVWEHLCFGGNLPPTPHHPSSASRSRAVVVALGGYRSLYLFCVQPALSRLMTRTGVGSDPEVTRRVWRRHGAQLSLSLFCVHYYEKLSASGGDSSSAAASSLMFLSC